MTQKWLVPIDGSETSLHSIPRVIANARECRETPKILLINVQPTLPNDIGRFINADTLREFHLESGMKALAAARDQLTAAGLPPELHVLTGEAAATIRRFKKPEPYKGKGVRFVGEHIVMKEGKTVG